MTEQSPEAGSVCPIFDLTDPTSNGFVLLGQNTWSIADTSSGSPTFVPTNQHNIEKPADKSTAAVIARTQLF